MKNKLGLLLQKAGLKKAALNIYFLVFNSREAARKSYRSKSIPRLIKERSKNGILAIDICTEHGLGAKISWCVEILAYCKEHQLQPAIRFSYPDNKNDYFEKYFSLKQPVSPDKATFTSINLMSELGFGKDYGNLLTLEEAYHLLNTYITVNEWVQDEVLQFCNQHFAGRKVIGVHYRGTDKVGEAPEVPYEKVVRNIQHIRKHYLPEADVFLSTDDNKFAAYLQSQLPTLQVIMRKDYQRSDNDQPVHLNNSLDKFEVNRDAIINCLLLSRCDFLLKTSSFLSDISKLYNPSLPVVMLNRPYERAFWFPAREIAKTIAFEQLD